LAGGGGARPAQGVYEAAHEEPNVGRANKGEQKRRHVQRGEEGRLGGWRRLLFTLETIFVGRAPAVCTITHYGTCTGIAYAQIKT
jgi:hypothetical protein